MKRFFALVLIMLLLLPAAAFAGETPPDVREYAEDTVMPMFKGYMKNPADVWLDKFTAEEIDAMTLGGGTPVYIFDELSPDSISGITASEASIRCFSLDTAEGPAALFHVVKDINGELSYEGIESADNLNQAMAVLKRIAEAEGVSFEPVLLSPRMTGYALCLSFNGDERVITVPASGMGSLDKAYDDITDHRLLSTLKELKDACREQAEFIAAHSGKYGGGPILLLPHSEPVSSAADTGAASILKSLLPFFAALAVVAAAAFAVLIAHKRRSRPKAVKA